MDEITTGIIAGKTCMNCELEVHISLMDLSAEVRRQEGEKMKRSDNRRADIQEAIRLEWRFGWNVKS